MIRLSLVSLAVIAIFVQMPASADETKHTQSQTLGDGRTIELAQPTLIYRQRGFLWFPTLIRLAGGDLVAVMNNYSDEHVGNATGLLSFSADEGKTWSEPFESPYVDVNLRRSDGSQTALPYYLRPRAEGLIGTARRFEARGRRSELLTDQVVITGLPKPDQSLAPKFGLAGFVINGQVVTARDGTYLTTLYGRFVSDKRFSLLLVESTDGLAWKYRTTIAGPECKLEGQGPCESAMCRMKDGRLLCVFRNAAPLPYAQTFSDDDGRTWTEPTAMPDCFSVQPSLTALPDGTIVLSGGRPGIFAWFNTAGDGKTWEAIDLRKHHNACVPDEPIGEERRTSSYTEIIPLDANRLLCIYDRIPNGWNAIPADSRDTNSVWVVELRVSSKAAD